MLVVADLDTKIYGLNPKRFRKKRMKQKNKKNKNVLYEYLQFSFMSHGTMTRKVLTISWFSFAEVFWERASTTTVIFTTLCHLGQVGAAHSRPAWQQLQPRLGLRNPFQMGPWPPVAPPVRPESSNKAITDCTSF